jgi:hypothetical protein
MTTQLGPNDIIYPFTLGSNGATLVSKDNCGNPIFWVNDEATSNIYGFSTYQQAVSIFDYVFEICMESYPPDSSPLGLCSATLPQIKILATDAQTGETSNIVFADYGTIYAVRLNPVSYEFR